MIVPGSASSLILGAAEDAYRIERSLRFNSADTAYLTRTPASSGSGTIMTMSAWVKRSKLGTQQGIFGSNFNYEYLGFNASDQLRMAGVNSNEVVTTRVFRDTSAWYHIMAHVDTTQATASDRYKIYINGVRETVFSSATYPAQNATTIDWNKNKNTPIGVQYIVTGPAFYFDGYLAEVYWIDGQALTPSSFGETDPNTGVWRPKKYTGTYGTNGFYLNFADNSGTTSTTLGKDSSGNGNNWTPNNFSVTAGAGNDSLVDTPTPYGSDTGAGGEVRGNYATLNPLGASTTPTATLANGNLDLSGTGSNFTGNISTIAFTSGKWYAEYLVRTIGVSGIGIVTQAGLPLATASVAGFATSAEGWYRGPTSVFNNNTQNPTGLSTITTNDIINIAVDFDAGKLWFGKNGTWDSSGNPATGANPTSTFTPSGRTFYFHAQGYNTWAGSYNFGQRPFAYTAPSGFKALCTQNLPTPTIGATSTTQANDYFDTILWTGDDVNPRNITGLQFQPDLVWAKSRVTVAGTNRDHQLFDAVRGADKALSSNLASSEDPASGYSNDGAVTAFLSNGFTVGGSTTLPAVNSNGATYVAWNWKANGAGSSNTAGTITSTVSANTTAGFSIVTYTGNGTAGATVGHGLGVAPQFMFFKRRSAADDWPVYHVSIGATNRLILSGTGASSGDATFFNDTTPTSTVFSIGTNTRINANTSTYVAYCFAPVAGYSAFGSYTGNGSADGPFVYTGFRPRYLLLKASSGTTGDWNIIDTARDTFNLSIYGIDANSANAENSTRTIDILSNGFKLRGTGTNINAATYIYAAFAESPFKYSLAR